MCLCAKLLESCLTLCNPMDCSLPVFLVHGILQARILEWVAMPSSRRSSQPRDWTMSLMSSALAEGPPGKPVSIRLIWLSLLKSYTFFFFWSNVFVAERKYVNTYKQILNFSTPFCSVGVRFIYFKGIC